MRQSSVALSASARPRSPARPRTCQLPRPPARPLPKTAAPAAPPLARPGPARQAPAAATAGQPPPAHTAGVSPSAASTNLPPASLASSPTASATGSGGSFSASGRQAPDTEGIPAAAARAIPSATNRDFPTPASPITRRLSPWLHPAKESGRPCAGDRAGPRCRRRRASLAQPVRTAGISRPCRGQPTRAPGHRPAYDRLAGRTPEGTMTRRGKHEGGRCNVMGSQPVRHLLAAERLLDALRRVERDRVDRQLQPGRDFRQRPGRCERVDKGEDTAGRRLRGRNRLRDVPQGDRERRPARRVGGPRRRIHERSRRHRLGWPGGCLRRRPGPCDVPQDLGRNGMVSPMGTARRGLLQRGLSDQLGAEPPRRVRARCGLFPASQEPRRLGLDQRLAESRRLARLPARGSQLGAGQARRLRDRRRRPVVSSMVGRPDLE